MRANRIIICTILAFCLTACAANRKASPPVPQSKVMAVSVASGAAAGAVVGSVATGVPNALTAVMGGIVGGAVGLKLTEGSGLHEDLLRGNVQIIRIGEDIMIVLPAHNFFYANSSHINEAFYPVLDNVAEFINNYQAVTIKIAGYTDNTGDKLRNLALSRQQAQNISNYLTRHYLDGRFIYATGYGDAFPIATNDTLEGRYTNRRIQITFREIPAKVS